MATPGWRARWTGASWEIPLVSNDGNPGEKVEVRLVVKQVTRQVERGSMRVKESFRVKAVAQVKAGEGRI